MKKLILMVVAALALAAAATVSAGAQDWVCGPDCWGDLGNDTYSIPWIQDPIVALDDGGDNASSVCRDHGGVFRIEFKPGYGLHGESTIVAEVECMDGTKHTIDTKKKGQEQTGAADGNGGGWQDAPDPGAGDPPPGDCCGGSSGSPYDWSTQTGEQCNEQDVYGICIGRALLG